MKILFGMRITIFIYFTLTFWACYDFTVKKSEGGVADGDVTEASAVIGSGYDVGTNDTTGVANSVNRGVDDGISGAALSDAGPIESIVCDSDSCSGGCCDGTTCVKFDMQTPTQCGAQGTVCKKCPAGQACGSTGACGCDPTSCPDGCCADSKCVPPGSQKKDQCGAEGAACKPCADGQTCADGKCICNPTTCPNGCCAGNKCVLSKNQSKNSCGNNGNACGACSPGEDCVGGECSCGGASCKGCCSDGKCVSSSNSTCGVSGGKCVSCEAKQRCNSEGKCICDSNSCASGCCDSEGQCQTPSATACGTGGKACRACSLSKATAGCTNGQCSVASCTNNYGDCNDTASDGCETNLLTSKANCGECDNDCPARTNSSAPSCKSGECAYTCNSGYNDTGTACVNTDDCASNPCPSNAKCIDKVSGYSCDYCSANPCKNGGTCTSSSSGPKCSCATGYSGDTCEDSKIWYKDCDADGYAASRDGAVSAPKKPSTTTSCASWIEKEPKNASTTDCDDAKAYRHPGADYGLPISQTGQTLPSAGNSAYDLNCDGMQEVNTQKMSVGEVVQGNVVVIPSCTTSEISCNGADPECIDAVSGTGSLQCGISYGHVACLDREGESSAYYLCR